MDKKTYEYMKERTGKYKALKDEREHLLRSKSDIQNSGGIGIRTDKGIDYFSRNVSEKLADTLKNFIDSRLSEIDKEMEEI